MPSAAEMRSRAVSETAGPLHLDAIDPVSEGGVLDDVHDETRVTLFSFKFEAQHPLLPMK